MSRTNQISILNMPIMELRKICLSIAIALTGITTLGQNGAPLYVVGDFNGWNPMAPAQFSYINEYGKDFYRIEFDNTSYFKITTVAGDWEMFNKYCLTCDYCATPEKEVPLYIDEEKNKLGNSQIMTPWRGRYVVEVSKDLSTIKLIAKSAEPKYELYLIGDMTGWTADEAWKMSYIESGIYKFECNSSQNIFADTHFKIGDPMWDNVIGGYKPSSDNMEATYIRENSNFQVKNSNQLTSELVSDMMFQKTWNGVLYLDIRDPQNSMVWASADKTLLPGWEWEYPKNVGGDEPSFPAQPDDPGLPELPELTNPVVICADSFEYSLGGWEVFTVWPDGYYEGWDIYYRDRCAYCNSYYLGENHPANSTMSKDFDLTDYSQVIMSVEQSFGFTFPQTQTENFQAYVLCDGEKDYLTFTNFPTEPAEGNWAQWSENKFDLSKYAGKEITICFEYTSDGSQSLAWQLRNFVLTGEPIHPDDTEKYELIYFKAFDDIKDWTSINDESLSRLGWYIYTTTSSRGETRKYTCCNPYYDETNHPGHSILEKTFDLSGYADLSISYEQAFGFTFPQEESDNYRIFVRCDGETAYLPMLNFPAPPASGNWTYEWAHNSYDLSDYDGQKITVGFEYLSDGSLSRAWEIRNFELKGTRSGTVGIDDNIYEAGEDFYTVYDLTGRCVLRHATVDELRKLAKGTYIVNGQKKLIY